MDQIAEYVDCHPDFIKGVMFQDIRRFISAPTDVKEIAFKYWVSLLQPFQPTVLVALETRGRELAAELCHYLSGNVRYVLAIKAENKLPGKKVIVSPLGNGEYGQSRFKLNPQDIKDHDRVVIIDDLGGTFASMCVAVSLIDLISEQYLNGNAKVVAVSNFIQLCDIDERQEQNMRALVDKKINISHCLMFSATTGKYIPAPSPQPSPRLETNVVIPFHNKSQIIVFHHPSVSQLANLIVNAFPSVFRHANMLWGKFPDKTHNIRFEADLRNRDVLYLGSTDTETLVEQIALCMVLPRQHIRSLFMCFPFLSSGTMERVSTEGELAMAEPMVKMMSSSIPSTQRGRPVLQFFDLHALVEQFYTTDNVVMERPGLSGIPLLLEELKHLRSSSDQSSGVYIAFPDTGSYSRFHTMFEPEYKDQMIICCKMRTKAGRFVTIIQGMDFDPKDVKHVVIVDDLVQSGGTLFECLKGIKSVYKKAHVHAYVTHAVFPNHSYRKFLKGGAYEGFHTFYITNTIQSSVMAIDQYASGSDSPFEILNIAPLIVRRLMDHFVNDDMREPIAWYKALAPYYIVTSDNKHKIQSAHRIRASIIGTADLHSHGSFPRYSDLMDKNLTSSLVSDQPKGSDEIRTGAINRARNSVSITQPHVIISFENGVRVLLQQPSGLPTLADPSAVSALTNPRFLVNEDDTKTDGNKLLTRDPSVASTINDYQQSIKRDSTDEQGISRECKALDCCYVFVRIRSPNGDVSEDGAFSSPVPVAIDLIDQIKEGETIGHVMNRVYGYDNSDWHQNFGPLFLNRVEIMTRAGRRLIRTLLSRDPIEILKDF